MRKLIVTNIMSLDGYYEGPGRDVMALPMDDFFDHHNAERLRAADTLLLGRTTYELFKGFWPRMKHDPSATEVVRAISRLNDAIDKLVVSDTLTAEQTAPWQANTTIVRRRDISARLAELQREPGREILTFGSRTLWSSLLPTGLVDELHIIVGAALLGAGTPLFQSPAPARLTLLGAHTSKGSNNVVLRYGVSTPA